MVIPRPCLHDLRWPKYVSSGDGSYGSETGSVKEGKNI